MLEALVLSGCLNLNVPAPINKGVRNLLGLLVAAPAFSSSTTSSFPTPLGVYNYDVAYQGINIADACLKFKEFETTDLSGCASSNELLQRIIAGYQGSQLYTMEFTFNVADTPFIGAMIKRFYDNAMFKTIGVMENDRVRPLFSMMDAIEEDRHDITFTLYDRRNNRVVMQNQDCEEICSDTFEPEVFRNILDPLSIVTELITRKPRVGDATIRLGSFYTERTQGHLFPVELRLVREDRRHYGEILLPSGVFLEQDSVLVRTEYSVEEGGRILVPNIRNSLLLKPASGIASYAPGWAETIIRE